MIREVTGKSSSERTSKAAPSKLRNNKIDATRCKAYPGARKGARRSAPRGRCPGLYVEEAQSASHTSRVFTQVRNTAQIETQLAELLVYVMAY
jgi:hypothetical protein